MIPAPSGTMPLDGYCGGDPSFAGQKIVKNKRVGQPSRWIVLRKQGITPRSLGSLYYLLNRNFATLSILSWAAHSVGRNKTGGKYNKDIITKGCRQWEGKGTCVRLTLWVLTFKSQLVTCAQCLPLLLLFYMGVSSTDFLSALWLFRTSCVCASEKKKECCSRVS